MSDEITYLNDNVLKLPYYEWENYLETYKEFFSTELKQWLYQWNMFDLLGMRPNDKERRLVRYGHYLGWFHYIMDIEKLNTEALDADE